MLRAGSFRPLLSLLVLLAAFQLSYLPPASGQAGPPPLTVEERQSAIETIARLLTDNYVFPDLGRKAGEAVLRQQRAGAYAQLGDPFAFADAVTRDLQEILHDRHLRVVVRPPGAPSSEEEESEEGKRRMVEQLRADHYGFRELRMLPGNLGYLRLDSFEPPNVAGPTAVAAMNFLQGSDAVIFDLRQNGGGEPAMVQLLLSYLFDEPTHLNDFYQRKGDRIDQVWSLPWVSGSRMPKVPVFVLASARTFSGGEEFAYNLKALKRATLVGETTGGGANPGEGFDVGERLGIFVPNGRPIHPVTGTNWEGTGVEPDVKVPSKEALLAAQGAALEALAKQADSPLAAARYRYAKYWVESEHRPFAPPAAKLRDYAATYGPFRVFAEGGALSFEDPRGSRRTLLPVAEDVFRIEGDEGGPLLRFERGPDGRVVKVSALHSTGESDEIPRNP
jgi:hypothetical protein